MMGPTHALGGVAFLAGAAIVSGHPDLVPFWGFGLAAVSALIPDGDQPHATVLNKPWLLPAKFLTWPLWGGQHEGTRPDGRVVRTRSPWPWRQASHRGRTHSLVGLGIYLAIVAFWFSVLAYAGTLTGRSLAVPWNTILISCALGYVSHITLDLLNTKGVQVLWPLPARIVFPPWPAFRFKADSFRADVLVAAPCVMVVGYFLTFHMADLAHASHGDNFIMTFVAFCFGLAGDLLRLAIGFAMSFH